MSNADLWINLASHVTPLFSQNYEIKGFELLLSGSQAVLLSSYIAFVELTENRSLFVYIGRYDESEGNIIVFITPEGDVNNEI